MNKEYDVSVIIPIYNSEEYIEQGIQSVLNQPKIEVELILVNDGSTDGSAGIIDEYAKKYDSLKQFIKKMPEWALQETEGFERQPGNTLHIWTVMIFMNRRYYLN